MFHIGIFDLSFCTRTKQGRLSLRMEPITTQQSTITKLKWLSTWPSEIRRTMRDQWSDISSELFSTGKIMTFPLPSILTPFNLYKKWLAGDPMLARPQLLFIVHLHLIRKAPWEAKSALCHFVSVLSSLHLPIKPASSVGPGHTQILSLGMT